MNKLIILASFTVAAVVALSLPADTARGEGIYRVSSGSETVAAAPGKSVSSRSVCPAGAEVIGGGGECYGFLVTDGRAVLSKSSPTPDGSAWYVECVNAGGRPGDIQAKAWAVCADPDVLGKDKKK